MIASGQSSWQEKIMLSPSFRIWSDGVTWTLIRAATKGDQGVITTMVLG